MEIKVSASWANGTLTLWPSSCSTILAVNLFTGGMCRRNQAVRHHFNVRTSDRFSGQHCNG
jgi:hypothetical protein